MSLHPYIKIQGKCIECNNPLNGECEERPAENLNVIFKIETLDTCGIPHMKKRQLHRTERKNCQDKLINVKALQHYKEVANMEMSFGDPEPAHIPKPEVLRKTRQEGRDKKDGH